jgi:hypothetical protein
MPEDNDVGLFQLGEQVVFFCGKAQSQASYPKPAYIDYAFDGYVEQAFTGPPFFDAAHIVREAWWNDLAQFSEIPVELINLGENSVTVQHAPPVPNIDDRSA